jgi:hypothetical protein
MPTRLFNLPNEGLLLVGSQRLLNRRVVELLQLKGERALQKAAGQTFESKTGQTRWIADRLLTKRHSSW